MPAELASCVRDFLSSEFRFGFGLCADTSGMMRGLQGIPAKTLAFKGFIERETYGEKEYSQAERRFPNGKKSFDDQSGCQ
jgi:hypothetical protein